MRTMRLYALRTCSLLCGDLAATVGSALFLAVSSAVFTHSLVNAEGTLASLPALWAVALACTLPCLLALVTMRLVADDRLSGRLELLLASPISERGYVLGRWLGAMLYVGLVLAAYLAVPTVILPLFARSALPAGGAVDFLPALVGIWAQVAAGSAIALAVSAGFSRAAIAGAVSAFLLLALPRAAYRALVAWNPSVRAAIPVFPAEAQLADVAIGVFSLAGIATCAILAAVALFIAVRLVGLVRLAGAAARFRRWATMLEMLLALALAFSAAAAVAVIDVPLVAGGRVPGFSPRTLSILGETQGETRITCFLSRRSPAWRATSRLLRGFAAASRMEGAADLAVDFIDPRWDLAAATRLKHLGVKEGTLLFERARRRVEVSVADADESALASAMLRLSLPASRNVVYFTSGHGELALDGYDPVFGLSSLARALRRDGYELKALDTLQAASIPGDCGVLVVAGARTAFSEVELAAFDAYLRQGGRALVMVAAAAPQAGVARLLADWGVRTPPFVAVSPRTLDGTDLVARDYGAHEITDSLKGTSMVFHDALPVEALDGAGSGENAFMPLVQSDAEAWGESDVSRRPWTYDAAREPAGPLVLAAAVERGIGRRDLAAKPARLVVVGDASLVVNGALASRANANRDFFRNALAWLAGLDAVTATATPADVLVTGMDRDGFVRFLAVAAGLLPLVFVLLAVMRRLIGRRN